MEYRGCLQCMTVRVRLNRRRSPAALDDGEVAATARWNLPLPAAARCAPQNDDVIQSSGDAKVTPKTVQNALLIHHSRGVFQQPDGESAEMQK